MNIKSFAALLISFFSINVLSHEISQDGDNISALQKYKGNSYVEITLGCLSKGKGLNLHPYYTDIDIKLPRPIDMRMTDDKFYKVLIGGYEVCRKPFDDLDEHICENLTSDLYFGETAFDFLEHTPTIQIQEVSLIDQVRSETGRGFPAYKYSCPLGWDEFGWNRCKSAVTVYNFDLNWFSKAYKDMSKQCEIHQDKVTSHIKRILDF